MRIHIGSDHAGFALKIMLIKHLREDGHTVVDHGPTDYLPGDDYPAQSIAVAKATVADPDTLGLVIGGTGNGEQMAANKVKGARAALIWSIEAAELAREVTNANIAAVGARMHGTTAAFAIVEAFLKTAFDPSERHTRRLDQLARYERFGTLD